MHCWVRIEYLCHIFFSLSVSLVTFFLFPRRYCLAAFHSGCSSVTTLHYATKVITSADVVWSTGISVGFTKPIYLLVKWSCSVFFWKISQVQIGKYEEEQQHDTTSRWSLNLGISVCQMEAQLKMQGWKCIPNASEFQENIWKVRGSAVENTSSSLIGIDLINVSWSYAMRSTLKLRNSVTILFYFFHFFMMPLPAASSWST